ncbi:MAG: UMP kinase [Elusimicrobiota bacterium]
MMAIKPKYKRIILKLSGEVLKGDKEGGIDAKTLKNLAEEIAEVHRMGVELCIVIGGGNIWRGLKEVGDKGIHRVTSDYIGMLATIINAMALQDALEKEKVATRVQSAIEITKLSEPYIRRKAVRHLEKGRVVIFAGGTGNPYFTTDTTAALRANEVEAEIIFKGTKVDGVYNDDPGKNPQAKKFDRLSFMEAIRRRLKIMDVTALSLCMDNDLPVLVFNMQKKGNLRRAVIGEKVGTIIQ